MLSAVSALPTCFICYHPHQLLPTLVFTHSFYRSELLPPKNVYYPHLLLPTSVTLSFVTTTTTTVHACCHSHMLSPPMLPITFVITCYHTHLCYHTHISVNTHNSVTTHMLPHTSQLPHTSPLSFIPPTYVCCHTFYCCDILLPFHPSLLLLLQD